MDSDLTVSAIAPFGEFSVQCVASQSDLKFNFKYAPRVWRSLRLGFLASTRTDLYVGVYSASILPLNSDLGGKRGATTIQTVQFNNIQNHQKSIARPFINGVGISADSTGLQVQI